MADPVTRLVVGNATGDVSDIRVATGIDAPTDSVWKVDAGISSFPQGADSKTTTVPDGFFYFKRSGKIQTSNGWSYSIDNNGVCKCWKRLSIGSKHTSGGWGSGYYVVLTSASDLVYPVTFKSVPAVFVTPMNDSYNFWLYSEPTQQASTTSAPGVCAYRQNSAQTITGIYLCYFVIGVV